jgi:hypothetical protein
MDPAQVGKIGEIEFAMALVKREFNVFSPVVDAGIDLVAEKLTGGGPPFSPRYLSFQVRTSNYHPKEDWWTWTISKYNFRLGSDSFYALVLEDEEKVSVTETERQDGILVLIIPSREIWEHTSANSKAWQKGGDYPITVEPHYFVNRGRYTWAGFLNRWDLLT